MRSLRSITCAAIPLLLAAVYGQPESRRGLLSVYIISPAGTKLPGGRLSIYSEDGRLSYSGFAKDQTTVTLPYGRYTIKFNAEFVQGASRNIMVDRADQFVVLATDMERIVLDARNEPVSVSLRTHPAKSCAADGFLWAKLAGVFSDYSAEARVSTNGFVLFEPVQPGAYVVAIIDGQRIRALQPVGTRGSITVVDLTLSACEKPLGAGL